MIYHGDLFDVLPTLADASIDAGVTDPPYGIGFMGREWDTFKPENVRDAAAMKQRKDPAQLANLKNVYGRKRSPAQSPSQVEYDYTVAGLRGFQEWTERWASEVLRVLKPGAYIVVCGAPRSHHRMMCGLEDAGFVVRDCLAWLFGSGFPKNKNLGNGRGTALKPAHEPIALAWKPFKGSISANVAAFGTGALNIDACRIAGVVDDWPEQRSYSRFDPGSPIKERTAVAEASPLGRWPANVLLDEVAAAMLDEQTGELTSGSWDGHRNVTKLKNVYEGGDRPLVEAPRTGDSGGASRFYYVAKPSREERDMGTHVMELRQRDDSRKEGNPGGNNPRNRGLQPRGNFHPTVKPIELMRWLVRLVTPPGGTVLDPFGGSFTTAMACVYEQRQFVIIEREADYVEIGVRRVRAVNPLFVDADALQVRHVASVRSPDDVLSSEPSDRATLDSASSRSVCSDPCDEAAVQAGPDHE